MIGLPVPAAGACGATFRIRRIILVCEFIFTLRNYVVKPGCIRTKRG
ncbi:hypothetical protein BSLA_01f3429 [Burkholderia stabilis]|nr:hypothetical protein BSLA_01f3429 [Burkholderia stabilis]